MTREEAKEILTHNWTRVDNPNYSESELDEAFFMAIEALSDGWIPCWERLPKEGEPVLITDCGYVDGLAWVAKDGAWESDHAYTGSVTAWMPLPKPYKGGDDE